MKKISLDFVSKKSKETEIYKFLNEKFDCEIGSFDGFVNDAGMPQGACMVGIGFTDKGILMMSLNFVDSKIVGSASLVEIEFDSEITHNLATYNFVTENYGEILYTNGNTYEGEMKFLRQNGKGKMTEENGDFSIGFYEDGKKHGLILNYDHNGNLIYKSVYYDNDCFISSDNDEEILQCLNKLGFNYSDVLNSLTKLNTKLTAKENLKHIKNGLMNIDKHMIGQKKVLKIVDNHLLLSLLCARQEDKPITSMVFTGPTGVGKTELAKQISLNLFDKKPFTVDFANFHGKFMLSSLIGSSAGYIGSDQEPEFLKYVRENAETGGVLLFEEIDKSAEECLNFFMRILDEGEVLDAHNVAYSVKNFVIIATTNFSANTTHKLGFSGADDDVKMQLAKTETTGMKKEQLARFGLVVEFDSFNKDERRQLTLMALNKAVERIKTIQGFNIKIKFSEKFVDELTDKVNSTFGVRDIQSRASNTINEKLAEFIRNNDCQDISVKFNSLDDVVIKENKPKKPNFQERTR